MTRNDEAGQACTASHACLHGQKNCCKLSSPIFADFLVKNGVYVKWAQLTNPFSKTSAIYLFTECVHR